MSGTAELIGWRLVSSCRRFRGARREGMASCARPQRVPGRAGGSGSPANDARQGFGRDNSRDVDPAAVAASRSHDRLCRGEGRAFELEPGPVERGRPEGCPRGPGLTGLGRNGSRGRSRSGDRTAEPHGLRRRPKPPDDFNRRHPDRAPGEAKGSGGPHGLPCLAPSWIDHGYGMRHRWRHRSYYLARKVVAGYTEEKIRE